MGTPRELGPLYSVTPEPCDRSEPANWRRVGNFTKEQWKAGELLLLLDEIPCSMIRYRHTHTQTHTHTHTHTRLLFLVLRCGDRTPSPSSYSSSPWKAPPVPRRCACSATLLCACASWISEPMAWGDRPKVRQRAKGYPPPTAR